MDRRGFLSWALFSPASTTILANLAAWFKLKRIKYFTYHNGKETVSVPYHTLLERLTEMAEELTIWHKHPAWKGSSSVQEILSFATKGFCEVFEIERNDWEIAEMGRAVQSVTWWMGEYVAIGNYDKKRKRMGIREIYKVVEDFFTECESELKSIAYRARTKNLQPGPALSNSQLHEYLTKEVN